MVGKFNKSLHKLPNDKKVIRSSIAWVVEGLKASTKLGAEVDVATEVSKLVGNVDAWVHLGEKLSPTRVDAIKGALTKAVIETVKGLTRS